MKIGDLENKLFKKFPLATAEDWDTNGLTSGDRDIEIKSVAVALDPTLSAVKEAKALGCNLLLTHHPAYIGEIEEIPASNIIFEAPNYGVALMNFHTTLDISKEGSSVLPNMLDLKIKKTLLPTYEKLGFGKICSAQNEEEISLDDLAKSCQKVFGKKPRVWGKPQDKVKKIVTTTGSVGRLDDEVSVLQAAIDNHIECIICGEVKYHDAVALQEMGMAIIDLGHDVSELPLCGVLVSSLVDAGIEKDKIIEIDQHNYWF